MSFRKSPPFDVTTQGHHVENPTDGKERPIVALERGDHPAGLPRDAEEEGLTPLVGDLPEADDDEDGAEPADHAFSSWKNVMIGVSVPVDAGRCSLPQVFLIPADEIAAGVV